VHRGYFIVFEGPDGSGKSTQVDLLSRALTRDGHSCVVTEEPGGTPEGERIRDILLNPGFSICEKAELFLFLADRAEHVCSIVEPALADDKIVISSRYFYSTLVYQGIARKTAKLDFLKLMNLYAVNNVEPDLVFYLDVFPEQGMTQVSRRESDTAGYHGGDRIEREGVSFQKRVREGYLQIASQYRDIFVVLECGDIASIHDEVYRVTKRRLGYD
jgi:dTMP kinase